MDDQANDVTELVRPSQDLLTKDENEHDDTGGHDYDEDPREVENEDTGDKRDPLVPTSATRED